MEYDRINHNKSFSRYVMSYPFRLRPGSVAEKKAKNGVNSEKKLASKLREEWWSLVPGYFPLYLSKQQTTKTHLNATFDLMTGAVSAGSSCAVIAKYVSLVHQKLRCRVVINCDNVIHYSLRWNSRQIGEILKSDWSMSVSSVPILLLSIITQNGV